MNYLLELPREILREVCLYLSTNDINNVDQLAPGSFEDEYFWKRYFGLNSNLPFIKLPSIKDQYISLYNKKLVNGFDDYMNGMHYNLQRSSFSIKPNDLLRLPIIHKFNPYKFINIIKMIDFDSEYLHSIVDIFNIRETNNIYEFDVGLTQIDIDDYRIIHTGVNPLKNIDKSIFHDIVHHDGDYYDFIFDHVVLTKEELTLLLNRLYYVY